MKDTSDELPAGWTFCIDNGKLAAMYRGWLTLLNDGVRVDCGKAFGEWPSIEERERVLARVLRRQSVGWMP